MNMKSVGWILRIAVAGEFVGHGVFAMQGKKDWIGWFANFGVSDAGTVTQLLFRAILLWAVFWGFWTALLRPIVGMPIWDFVERWANWGAPLALLLLIGWPQNWREWFKQLSSGE